MGLGVQTSYHLKILLLHTRKFIFYISGHLGRDERFFDKFVVSPDNKLLVFLGKDGYMPLVSNKVNHFHSNNF